MAEIDQDTLPVERSNQVSAEIGEPAAAAAVVELEGWEGDRRIWSVQDGAITGQTTAAVALGLATFTARDYHLLFQNASDGGIAGDPSTLAGVDPLYLFDSAGDYRLSQASPGVNSALDTGLYLLPQYPATAPRFLGAGPDRGGRESF